jgi:hypothetical protein
MVNLLVLDRLGTLKILHLISSVSTLWRCPAELKVSIAGSQWNVFSSVGNPEQNTPELDRKVL